MTREIGSEFWDVPITNKNNGIFPSNTQWFLSGRSALQAIIKELKGCHTVAMPSWCCDSMIKPFIEAGMEVYFYPVYYKKELIQEVNVDCDVLFLMDYFGYKSRISKIREYNGTVIRDVTHSIFSLVNFDADYYFGSLRKWCGVWTGGFCWSRDGHKLVIEDTDDGEYTLLRQKAMQLKNCYINGYVDDKGHNVKDKGYLKFYDAAEECLEHIGIAPAAKNDLFLAKKINLEYIKKRRRENAEVLISAFRDWLIFPEMADSDCPMFVPILVPNNRRNELRNFLIKSDIYCPIHWPVSRYHKLNENEQFIYSNELSLVCDQRYTEDDMCRMVETIMLFLKEE